MQKFYGNRNIEVQNHKRNNKTKRKILKNGKKNIYLLLITIILKVM